LAAAFICVYCALFHACYAPNLDGNEMGNDGRLALAEAMRLNTTVRELDIIGILPGQSL
jgi:hypothetical protein